MINRTYVRQYLERCEATITRASVFSCTSCEVRHLELFFYPGKETISFIVNQLQSKMKCFISETDSGLYISW